MAVLSTVKLGAVTVCANFTGASAYDTSFQSKLSYDMEYRNFDDYVKVPNVEGHRRQQRYNGRKNMGAKQHFKAKRQFSKAEKNQQNMILIRLIKEKQKCLERLTLRSKDGEVRLLYLRQQGEDQFDDQLNSLKSYFKKQFNKVLNVEKKVLEATQLQTEFENRAKEKDSIDILYLSFDLNLKKQDSEARIGGLENLEVLGKALAPLMKENGMILGCGAGAIGKMFKDGALRKKNVYALV